MPLIGLYSDEFPVLVYKGHPFSADVMTEKLRILSDGTRIRYTKITSKEFRDSEGRVRIEQFPQSPSPGQIDDQPTTVLIFDPTSQEYYELVPLVSIARPQPWPIRNIQVAPGRVPKPAPPMPESLRPRATNEDLGTKSLEGFVTSGTRTTETLPKGYEGNDRPIITVTDTWFSNDLNMVIAVKRTSPIDGETAIQLANIKQNDLPKSLFQVPIGYTVVRQPQD